MSLKLFCLSTDDVAHISGTDFSGYTDVYALAVIAENESAARQMAYEETNRLTDSTWWLNPKQTSCEEIPIDVPKILMLAEGTG